MMRTCAACERPFFIAREDARHRCRTCDPESYPGAGPMNPIGVAWFTGALPDGAHARQIPPAWFTLESDTRTAAFTIP